MIESIVFSLPAIGGITGLIIGLIISALFCRVRYQHTQSQSLSTINALQSRYAERTDALSQAQARIKDLQEELGITRERAATAEANLQTLNRTIATREQDTDKMQQQFQQQFENLAHKIFDEKSKTFHDLSQKGLLDILSPFKERVNEFQKIIHESFNVQGKEQSVLKAEIERIVAMNQQMSTQTQSLTNALKGDVKAQGNWGEIVLERLLEQSGLRQGEDYILQGAGLGLRHPDHATVQKPDVVVMLPENKHLIIDSKVSLVHYERYVAEVTGVAEPNDADGMTRTHHLKQFIASIKTHINDLQGRRYQDTDKLGTPDFVLMFMPIEGAYALAMQEAPDMHEIAWNRNIVLACPSTLFAMLRTIASVWRLEKQNRNTMEIAKQGGLLYDKVVGFVEDMEKLGTQIGSVQKSFDGAMNKLSTGRGNVIAKSEQLRKLGAKTAKTMPPSLIPSSPDDTVDE